MFVVVIMAFVAVFGMRIDAFDRRLLIVFEGVCGGQLLCLPGAWRRVKRNCRGVVSPLAGRCISHGKSETRAGSNRRLGPKVMTRFPKFVTGVLGEGQPAATFLDRLPCK